MSVILARHIPVRLPRLIPCRLSRLVPAMLPEPIVGATLLSPVLALGVAVVSFPIPLLAVISILPLVMPLAMLLRLVVS